MLRPDCKARTSNRRCPCWFSMVTSVSVVRKSNQFV
ncbi:hypothetical protein H3H32_14120 [Spirosoma foliorum]|uniref:Uncharacterized protein n=1 Tax=Spirosoma foliorum TaxID=2710596 RepID=A0A7G5H753_9BACT|nr:hypothetical protein H3H32_14120 [Spirosoma foliorum]